MPRLGVEKQADLLDVGAGGDVDEVVLVIGPEAHRPGEAMERREHLLEVPRIGDADLVERESRLWGDGADVADHARGQIPLRRKVDQFEPIDDEILMLAQRHRRPPPRPAVF